MINPLREGAINRSSEFKFDFSSQLWLIMNPPQTDFRFLSARNLPRPRYHPTPLPPWWKIFRPWKGRRSTGVQWHVRVLGEFGGRPTTSENDIHHLSPPFPSSSSSLSCSSSFFLSLSLYLSHTSLWSLEFSGPWILFHSRRFLHMQINPLDLNRARAYSWLTFEYPNLLGR